MKTKTGPEVTKAAQEQALIDQVQNVCNPHGSFNDWTMINALWWGQDVKALRERSVAYNLWVKSYLNQQGWFATR